MLRRLRIRNLRRYFVRYFKVLYFLSYPHENSVPLFIFGRQRSGTTMLQHIFEYSKYFKVYGEHHSKAFEKCFIKDFGTIKGLVHESKAPFTVFKPLCDSHRILEFTNTFPNSKSIWIYRNYEDTVNSQMRKFPNGGEAIEITKDICQGKTGSGWFYYALSDQVRETMQKIYKPEFTIHDYGCLAWWARNMLVLEKELATNKKVLLVDYDRLVQNPKEEASTIFNFIGVRFDDGCIKFIHSKSVGKNPFPEIDSNIKAMCLRLTNAIENSLLKNRQFHNLEFVPQKI
jgi:sulfotransferase family protein